ncbi:MAG TPA: tRNA (adenosine(37)-N6)-dimethylallyltransferase MiaA [Thermomicrobiales bacterium]|nr:tRNA (adenosine(37)-N6)-dimethylallyltransferase MiaA [Thermomicrobiales bacterium]
MGAEHDRDAPPPPPNPGGADESAPEAPPRIGGRGTSPLVVIAGPTAVGKTEAALALAHDFGSEIVSADSRQVYRGMDIGTAKPTPAERAAAPHHLLDLVDPDEAFSLADYQALAYRAIDAIHARGRVPLLVGGTPLYVNAVVEGWRLPGVPPSPALRAALEAEVARGGAEALARRLAAVDPAAAARAAGNPRRLIRALEVYAATGRPMSELEGKAAPPYRVLQVGLTLARPALHARADARADAMIAAGLVAEVRGLLDRGYDPALPAMSGIGYAEIVRHLAGDCSLPEAVAQIKADTHRYIRHQETWLRRNHALRLFDVAERDWLERLREAVGAFLEDEGESRE